MAAPIWGTVSEEDAIRQVFEKADEVGMRMEMIDSKMVWEAHPGLSHQQEVGRIFLTNHGPRIQDSPCGCNLVLDVSIVLRDGAIKRPDISLFCRLPNEPEGFVHQTPEAVIELTSPRYEDKDLVNGPEIYLRNGVQDVLVLDRRTNEVHHWSATGHTIAHSPSKFRLECGCELTV